MGLDKREDKLKCEECEGTGTIKFGYMKGYRCPCVEKGLRKNISVLRKQLEERDKKIESLNEKIALLEYKIKSISQDKVDPEYSPEVSPRVQKKIDKLYEEGKNPTGTSDWMGHTHYKKPPWED